MRSATSRLAATFILLPALVPVGAAAQIPGPSGSSGTVSVSFQALENTGHRLTDGTYIDNGRSRNRTLFLEADYSVTKRLSVSFAVPFVFARYIDDDAPPPFIPFLPVDQCRCWHSGWQDLSIAARLNVVDTLDHVLVISPSVAIGVPSHAYAYRGEAVIGRRLREINLAVDTIVRLDTISPRLSVHGRAARAFVQDVAVENGTRISSDRSHVNLGIDWRMSSTWSVRGFAAWQRVHGGLRMGSLPGSTFEAPGDVGTIERMTEHDRLLRDNNGRVGAGMSYQFEKIAVFGSVLRFVGGTDSHAGFAITTGVSLPFRIRR